MISLRAIALDEWPLYRDVRLQALLESPDAFGSTYGAEVDRTDEAWSSRVSAALTSGNDRALFARSNGEVCGLVWCKLSALEPERADIYQMWVAPASRGQGVGRALLGEAVAWATANGAKRICLGVTVGDTPAMRLYRGFGFVPSGPVEPLREGSTLMSQPMERRLAMAPDSRSTLRTG